MRHLGSGSGARESILFLGFKKDVFQGESWSLVLLISVVRKSSLREKAAAGRIVRVTPSDVKSMFQLILFLSNRDITLARPCMSMYYV